MKRTLILITQIHKINLTIVKQMITQQARFLKSISNHLMKRSNKLLEKDQMPVIQQYRHQTSTSIKDKSNQLASVQMK